MEKDWLFSTDEYICELRTVAVLAKENKILVQKDRNGNEFYSGGSHCKTGVESAFRFRSAQHIRW